MSETWVSLADTGRVGQALVALAQLRKVRQLAADEIVAEAELLDAASSSDLCLERAELILQRRDVRKDLAARALAVTGSQHFRMSRVEDAQRAFERGRALAAESRDRFAIAKVQIVWLGAVTAWVGPEAAVPAGSRDKSTRNCRRSIRPGYPISPDSYRDRGKAWRDPPRHVARCSGRRTAFAIRQRRPHGRPPHQKCSCGPAGVRSC